MSTETEGVRMTLANCACAIAPAEKIEAWDHKLDCPCWAPYFEFAWAWLWNYPNHKSEFRRALTKEEIPNAKKSLSLAMAYRWAYSPKNAEMDPRDLQSGPWIDKACVPLDGRSPAVAKDQARRDAKRIWQEFKRIGAMPEIPDSLIWDGAFLGVGICDVIPELEEG